MSRAFLAALLVAGATLLGCGGKDGTLSLNIVVSPVDDPFADATQVRITIGDSSHVKVVPVTAGKFDASIDLAPLSKPGVVSIDALDAAGNIVGHGQTLTLTLTAVDQGPIAVWVGRPGRVAAAAAFLPDRLPPTPTDNSSPPAAVAAARSEIAAVAITGLGILYMGGRSADGSAVDWTAVYSIYEHNTIRTTPLTMPRAGAVAGAIGQQALIFGGAGAAGVGATGSPLGTSELFDPTVSLGLFSPVPSDPIAARSHANLITLGSGNLFISGGVDADGKALDSAAMVPGSGTTRVNAVATPMAAARVGHAVTAVKFSDGDGALLFGGLPAGATGPVAERLVGQSLAAYDLPGATNRIGATASTLMNGTVLVLGGSVDGTAVSSGLLIDSSVSPPKVTPMPSLLSTERVGHTATNVGNDLLVCGGANALGVPQASCDVVDGSTLGIRTLMLGTARRDHIALPLETGPIIIAGGVGSDGAPLSSMEIYTP